MASSVCCTVGTTLEMATPVMRCCSMPRVPRSVWMKTPYSSAVCSRRVVNRHDASRREPLKTPILVLVLPTSMTSSMDRLHRDLARHHSHRLAALRPEQERPVQIQAHRDALAPVGSRRSAADALCAFEPGGQERAEPCLDEALVAIFERGQDRSQHFVDGPLASRFDPHGSRELSYRRREVCLVDVETDPENDVLE